MGLSRIKPEYAFMRSRVARRMVFLFIACALAPLAVMAFLAYRQVSTELESQSDERMSQTCKAAGMALINRIYLLDAVLDHAIDVNRQTDGNRIGKIGPVFSGYFTRAWLQNREGAIRSLYGTPGAAFAFTRQEQAHLYAGKTLIASRPQAGSFARIFMAKNFGSLKAGSPPVLVAEADSSFLWKREEITSTFSEVAVFSESGNALYSSLPKQVPIRELKAAMKSASAAGSLSWFYDGEPYLSRYRTLFIRPMLFENWVVLISEKHADVFGPLEQFRRTFVLVVLLSILVIVFLSTRLIRKSLVPIEQLKDATSRVAAKDFSAQVNIQTRDEFAELGESFNEMTRHLAEHVQTMETINDIGISLSAEKDQARLIAIVLEGAKKLIPADGAALYLLDSSRRLNLELMYVDSLNLAWDGKSIGSREAGADTPADVSIPISPPLIEQTVSIRDIYVAQDFDFSGQREFDARRGYRTQSILSVPLRNHLNVFIGVLQLINALDRRAGSVTTFPEQDIRVAESLASQVAVALTKNRLAEEFKRLFESLTELVATAVDAKSRHTGDHCKRVHILTMMIAEALNNTHDGPLAGLSLSENELYELKIAALLHDCGKVATPVHIMDKATKLEAITDRIQLVEQRFEILKREKRIDLLMNELQKIAAERAETNIADVDRKMRDFAAGLDADLDFLKVSNIGSEFMPESMRARVRDIARKYYWLNGDGKQVFILTDDEVENLTIATGTLSAAERALMNQHVDLTIKMLQTLPYPENLRNIPIHAGSHHERMDGGGYPFGLTRNEISLQGRILGLADAFEALTAPDRPYKAPKKLSEAMEVLSLMRASGHVDPDLYDMFIKENVHLCYAQKFTIDNGDGPR